MKVLLALFIGAFAASVLVLVAIARKGAPAPLRAYRESDDGIQPFDPYPFVNPYHPTDGAPSRLYRGGTA